jgi:UDP-N-acetylmuramoylalanine--D-glutamate ligase
MSEKPLSNAKSSQKLDLLKQRALVQTDEQALEFVAKVNGIGYINDSKSIRITETLESLERMETSVVLIVGGDDEATDYAVLSKQVKQKVNAIIYLGKNSDSVLKHFSTHNMLFAKALTIEESVQMAYLFAGSNDIVLFSPGCDHAHDYKVRGYKFKKEVNNLPGKIKK